MVKIKGVKCLSNQPTNQPTNQSFFYKAIFIQATLQYKALQILKQSLPVIDSKSHTQKLIKHPPTQTETDTKRLSNIPPLPPHPVTYSKYDI